MLTYQQLVALERSLHDTKVLSVYIAGAVADPAERHTWRISLDDALSRAASEIEAAAHEEREAFVRATKLLHDVLPAETDGLAAPGWAAFVDPGGVRYAERLPTSVRTLVAWDRGPRVAPYLRVLAWNDETIVAVVCSRDARIYRQRGGELEELEMLHVQEHGESPARARGAPSGTFHPGVRGMTGADEWDRVHRVELARMARELAGRLLELAGDSGWIVIGGTPEAAHSSAEAVDHRVASRVIVLPSLGVGASGAAVRRAAVEGAARLRQTRQAELISGVLADAAADRRGVVGLKATLQALKERRVQQLFLSHRFIDEHMQEAEEAVRAAFDQGAKVEEISGAAAERLDAHGGGVAARLRFTLRPVEAVS